MKTNQEKKILAKLKEVRGKFRISHQGQCDGKRQTNVLIMIDKKYYTGNAQCSRKDKFSKKMGRVVAFGRAMNNFENKRSITVPKEKRFGYVGKSDKNV